MNSAFFYASPLGTLRIAEEDGALTSAVFTENAGGTAPTVPVLCEAEAWLDRYFAGRDPGPVPPLAPKGTAFQKAVWQAISRVPYGETISYGALAVSMGLSPRHARAVGSALHRNPLLLFIPCHRAIGKNGDLTGFAAGIDRKRTLLERERV
ncbi:MAG: methylated-DNA--[Treponema sp.]|nr:methylated-DNA--[protein]-cysteine S-methyltransferase [Treponema sp.]